jgi:deazaflavin-dependent oxidoreductase (nitroreductase family)
MSDRSRGARALGRTLRMPGALDRKGTRWLLQALSPATVIVLVHRGRKSGRLYKTPVEVLAGDPAKGEVVVSPMMARLSDWYRNVVAGGLVEVHVRGETWRVDWRELSEAERRTAMNAYRHAHPRYSRMIVGMLARVNKFEGDPDEAVLRELPMLGLRRVG